MANYKISGVWRSSEGVITHLLIHPPSSGGGWKKGIKSTVSEVVSMYNDGDRFQIIVWNYKKATWDIEEEVKPVINKTTKKTYLRSHKDNQATDNLDNLISMKAIV